MEPKLGSFGQLGTTSDDFLQLLLARLIAGILGGFHHELQNKDAKVEIEVIAVVDVW